MSAQREIRKQTPLLDGSGRLVRPGYARKMVFDYERRKVRGRPFALKEWDFYQVRLGQWILQMTIGHVSYASSVSAALFSPATGERHEIGRLAPLSIRNMGNSPDVPHRLEAGGKGWTMAFDRQASQTLLSLRTQDDSAEIELVLPRDPLDDRMVIATPFAKPSQFYLNSKEHFYGISGCVRFGDLTVKTSEGDTALLDWGRGVWPFRQDWYWGCGCGWIGGRRVGFNIGWGFGDLSWATENMFFVDGRAVKLGTLETDMDEREMKRSWRFRDEEGLLDLTMTPVYDNFTTTKLLWVDNSCHQVFGRFDGWARTPEGEKISIEGLEAFVEHAHNRW